MGPPAQSPSRRTCAQNFYVLTEIRRPQSGLNPRTLDLEASTLPRDHRGRHCHTNLKLLFGRSPWFHGQQNQSNYFTTDNWIRSKYLVKSRLNRGRRFKILKRRNVCNNYLFIYVQSYDDSHISAPKVLFFFFSVDPFYVVNSLLPHSCCYFLQARSNNYNLFKGKIKIWAFTSTVFEL